MANLITTQSFKKLLRSFEVYLEASNIEELRKSRANLLLDTGSALQEIYYNLPSITYIYIDKIRAGREVSKMSRPP